MSYRSMLLRAHPPGIYPPTTATFMPPRARRCIPRKGRRDFWAIKGSWFAIEKGRLFCLLGGTGPAGPAWLAGWLACRGVQPQPPYEQPPAFQRTVPAARLAWRGWLGGVACLCAKNAPAHAASCLRRLPPGPNGAGKTTSINCLTGEWKRVGLLSGKGRLQAIRLAGTTRARLAAAALPRCHLSTSPGRARGAAVVGGPLTALHSNSRAPRPFCEPSPGARRRRAAAQRRRCAGVRGVALHSGGDGSHPIHHRRLPAGAGGGLAYSSLYSFPPLDAS